jgi:AcrR family transcriptional regulator
MKLQVSRSPAPRAMPVTDPRMRRTRDTLRRALLALLERKQLDQITIRDIAAEAGVGYATFFRHHASKEALLDEIAAEEIGRLMAMVLPMLDVANTRVSCLALCEYVGKHRAIWSSLLTGGAAATLRAEFVRLARTGAAHARTSNWIPVELGAVYGVGATIEILSWWLRTPEGAYSAAQVAEFLDRLVVGPATTSAGPGATGGPATRVRRKMRR